jgi:hypothetical protein
LLAVYLTLRSLRSPPTSTPRPRQMAVSSMPLLTHRGGCHCGRVRFEVDAPAAVVAWDCNCSICAMKRNTHFVVPASRFRLLTSTEELTLYEFNTCVAKHWFCKTCGVQSFYNPRSNPDGVSVTVHCVEPGTLTEVTTRCFDGQNWEEFISKSGIRAHSKDTPGGGGAAQAVGTAEAGAGAVHGSGAAPAAGGRL